MSSIQFSVPAVLGEGVRQPSDGGDIRRATCAERYE